MDAQRSVSEGLPAEPAPPASSPPIPAGPPPPLAPPAPAEVFHRVRQGDWLEVQVRYRAVRLLGPFATRETELRPDERVVLRTSIGTEFGEVVRRPRPTGRARQELDGEVLRRATPEDLAAWRRITTQIEPEARRFCRERIEAERLPMHLALVEQLFGGEKMIFYFQSEDRVDFRALVRDLAGQFHTRIEMRQLGARDAARLLGDCSTCGQPLCCRRFLGELAPVNMWMAKIQLGTLDPSRISGRCGRLRCCLRYEGTTYRELRARLPGKGTLVAAGELAGTVTGQQILAQAVEVQLLDGRRAVIPFETLEWLQPRELQPGGGARVEEEGEDAERRRPRRTRRRKKRRGEGGPAETFRADGAPSAPPAPPPPPAGGAPAAGGAGA